MERGVFSRLMHDIVGLFGDMRNHARGELQALTLASGAIGIALLAARSSIEGFSFSRAISLLFGIGLIISALNHFETILFVGTELSVQIANIGNSYSSNDYYSDPSLLVSEIAERTRPLTESLANRGILTTTYVTIVSLIASTIVAWCAMVGALLIFFLRALISFASLLLFLTLPFLLIPAIQEVPKALMTLCIKLLVQNTSFLLSLNLISVFLNKYFGVVKAELTLQEAFLLAMSGPIILLMMYLGFKVGADVGGFSLGGAIRDVTRATAQTKSIATRMNKGTNAALMRMSKLLMKAPS